MNKIAAYNNFVKEIIDIIISAWYEAFKSLNKFHIGHNFEIGRIIVRGKKRIKIFSL